MQALTIFGLLGTISALGFRARGHALELNAARTSLITAFATGTVIPGSERGGASHAGVAPIDLGSIHSRANTAEVKSDHV